MFEFNEDGSLKLPDQYTKKIKENDSKMKTQRCIKVRRELVSDRAPKKCMLFITLSEAIADSSFVEKIYGYFNQESEVPTKFNKLSEREFSVEIGTCFKRCSDCNALVFRLKGYLQGNVIDEKGSCTYQGQTRNFCYEDYFQ